MHQGHLQDDNATGFIIYVRAKVNGVEEKYKVEKSVKIEKTIGEGKVAWKVAPPPLKNSIVPLDIWVRVCCVRSQDLFELCLSDHCYLM